MDSFECYNCGNQLNVAARVYSSKRGWCCSESCAKDVNELVNSFTKKDSINPSHYKSHPSGIECIQITEHMGFTLGNAVKYIWRADLKHDDGGIEDLKKALWYLNRELDKRQNQ